MNCDDYLSMLSTLPVEELGFGAARAHAATCRDCDRVTRVVAERERNMMMAFGELYPPMTVQPIAARAMEISRRRRIALYFRVGLGIAAGLAMFAFIALRRVVPTPYPGVQESFALQCHSPLQAVELVRRTLSVNPNVSGRYGSPVAVIEVAASPAEMQRVRSVLDRYDGPNAAQCAAQVTIPRAAPKVR
jgi:hypothetical protein